MYLKRLMLRHFRNIAQTEIVFSPSVNWIQGKNGQGKTNLLEAIHLVSTGRSFRTKKLGDLIAFGQNYFYIEADFYKEEVKQTLKIYYDEDTRKVTYNETTYPSLNALLGILPSVLLSPDDLSFVSGPPAERRRFLDLHIAQTDPLYVTYLGRYFKAMKQRNQLLKEQNEVSMDAWEEMMAESARYIVNKRQLAILELQGPAVQWMHILSHDQDTLQIQYKPSLEKPLQKAWEEMRPKEFVMGSTLIGPHRDDLVICVMDKAAKVFSSEGQKRSCINALRFAQWEHMKNRLYAPPLLGIDDFGIQLDQTRQNQLKGHLTQFNQVFLTSPIPEGGTEYHLLNVEKGWVINQKLH